MAQRALAPILPDPAQFPYTGGGQDAGPGDGYG